MAERALALGSTELFPGRALLVDAHAGPNPPAESAAGAVLIGIAVQYGKTGGVHAFALQRARLYEVEEPVYHRGESPGAGGGGLYWHAGHFGAGKWWRGDYGRWL